MKILGNRILVRKLPEEKKEGFQTVDVQDNFVYKGVIYILGDFAGTNDVYDGSPIMKVGDVVLFAKYSPDTHEIDVEGEKMKVINVDDVIAVL